MRFYTRQCRDSSNHILSPVSLKTTVDCWERCDTYTHIRRDSSGSQPITSDALLFSFLSIFNRYSRSFFFYCERKESKWLAINQFLLTATTGVSRKETPMIKYRWITNGRKGERMRKESELTITQNKVCIFLEKMGYKFDNIKLKFNWWSKKCRVLFNSNSK